MNQQTTPVMHHTRRSERFAQHIAYPHPVREPAQRPQPHMTHLTTRTDLDLRPQAAVTLHHTGALPTATTGNYSTAHYRRSGGHSRVKPPTPTTNPMKMLLCLSSRWGVGLVVVYPGVVLGGELVVVVSAGFEG